MGLGLDLFLADGKRQLPKLMKLRQQRGTVSRFMLFLPTWGVVRDSSIFRRAAAMAAFSTRPVSLALCTEMETVLFSISSCKQILLSQDIVGMVQRSGMSCRDSWVSAFAA